MIGRRAIPFLFVLLGLAAPSPAKPLPPAAVPGALDRIVEKALARPGAVGLQIAVGLADVGSLGIPDAVMIFWILVKS